MITAVIGHGRSAEGKGWGDRIDQCDIVIRMWECAWQNPADHGTRYDYGIIETHKSVLARFKEHGKRVPDIGWVASYLHSKLDSPLLLPEPHIVIDQRNWTRIEGLAIRGVGETGRWELTRGGIAACWAASVSAVDDEVVLVGLDNIYAGITAPLEQAFTKAYIDDKAAMSFAGYTGGVTKAGNHDFPAERRLIELVALRRGVNVTWAQEAWTGR